MPKRCNCCRIPNTTSKCCTQPSGGTTLTSCRLGGWSRNTRIKPLPLDLWPIRGCGASRRAGSWPEKDNRENLLLVVDKAIFNKRKNSTIPKGKKSHSKPPCHLLQRTCKSGRPQMMTTLMMTTTKCLGSLGCRGETKEPEEASKPSALTALRIVLELGTGLVLPPGASWGIFGLLTVRQLSKRQAFRPPCWKIPSTSGVCQWTWPGVLLLWTMTIPKIP